MQQLVRSFTLAILAAAALVGTAEGQISDAQRKQAIELNQKISEANKLYGAQKNEEAGKAYQEAAAILEKLQSELGDVAAAKGTLSAFDRTLDSLKKKLEARGVKLGGGDTPAPGTTTPAPAGGVSFTKDVAPILVARCKRCHIDRMSGQFSMASYDALMSGARGAEVVSAGDADSRLIELIKGGEMPPNGNRVPANEVAVLTKWITEGAKFDGPNKAAPLAAGAPRNNEPNLKVMQATGNEKVSFSRDIAPVLAESCVGCHGTRNPPNDLSLASFQRMLRGGDNGDLYVPGKPAESLLIMKLKGTAPDGQRMPRGRPALDDEVIAKFETWISEGAKFDGDDPAEGTARVAAVYVARHMSHDDLADRRLELADRNCRIGNPGEDKEVVETENFQVMGNVIKSRLEEISQIAEQQHDEVSKVLKLPAGEPLVKGKLTLFVFSRQYDYSEYGTMVEKREIPRDWRGHWRFNIVDAYACLAPPRGEEDSSERIIAENLVGAYIESLGTVPEWFSRGTARALSARLHPKAPAVQQWDERIPGILSSGTKPEALFDNGYSASNASVIAYGFVKGLLGKQAQFNQLIAALKSGDDFDAAFQKVYRTEPEKLIVAWARSASR